MTSSNQMIKYIIYKVNVMQRKLYYIMINRNPARGRIIKCFVILSSLIILNTSCTQINSVYKHASKETKEKTKPLEINLVNIDNTFLFKQDTNILFYKVNAEELIKLIQNPPKEYTLCISFYYWCSYSRINFDSILEFRNNNSKVQLVVIDTDDWLYQNNSRDFFKSKRYYNPILILDIEKYGYNFSNRKRWRNFIYDISGEKTKLYGNFDVILFNRDANILVYGNYFDEVEKLKNIIGN